MSSLWQTVSENVVFVLEFLALIVVMFLIAYVIEKAVKKKNNDTERVLATRKIVVIGVFSAIAAILMVLEFPVMADYCILALDGRTFYATHGHIYNKDHLPPMMDGDILIHGHTHVLKAENMGNYILLNPGSVSIPKEGNPPTYAVYENGIFTIKDFEGNTVREIIL